MSDLIFEDIYEPIKFQMKNKSGEVFDCQTQFRSTADNIEIENLWKTENSKYNTKFRALKNDFKTQLITQEEFDIQNEKLEGMKADGEIMNEKTLTIMVKTCGQTIEFWGQFSTDALSAVLQRLMKIEAEKYKKKMDMK